MLNSVYFIDNERNHMFNENVSLEYLNELEEDEMKIRSAAIGSVYVDSLKDASDNSLTMMKKGITSFIGRFLFTTIIIAITAGYITPWFFIDDYKPNIILSIILIIASSIYILVSIAHAINLVVVSNKIYMINSLFLLQYNQSKEIISQAKEENCPVDELEEIIDSTYHENSRILEKIIKSPSAQDIDKIQENYEKFFNSMNDLTSVAILRGMLYGIHDEFSRNGVEIFSNDSVSSVSKHTIDVENVMNKLSESHGFEVAEEVTSRIEAISFKLSSLEDILSFAYDDGIIYVSRKDD